MDKIVTQIEGIISPVYMVGGSVRDMLMGMEPKDYDFITPHDPDTIEQRIRDVQKKPFLTGKRFGTVGVRIGGHLVEITTFRTEWYREGNRKPAVTFVDDITVDLGRRDFTINAIAKRGDELLDPFGGQGDIDKGIIRCVGDAASRFKEDPLRMLRAARFSAQLGFRIHEDTFEAAKTLSYKILQVSKERWVAELDRLLLSRHVDRGLHDLMDMGLLRYMIPEITLQKDRDHSRLWVDTVAITAAVPADINIRWAALLHNMARPFAGTEEDGDDQEDLLMLGYEMVLRLGKYLRWSNKRIETVSGFVREQLREDSPLKKAINEGEGG